MKIIIYKIKDLETGDYYIGSTRDLKKRMRVHKCLNSNTSIAKNIIKNNNYELYILEERFVYNVEQQKILENLYVLLGRKMTNNCINIKIPHRFNGYRKWYDRRLYIHYGKREKMLNKYHNNKLIACN